MMRLPAERRNTPNMKKRNICICLAVSALVGATAVAAVAAEPIMLALTEDAAMQEQPTVNENLLVLRGNWADQSQYEAQVTVNGKNAHSGEVRWSVDADSYKNEFGFTGSLNGNDIVSVDEKTGKITAKNSGIVRVLCESLEDPEANTSVIVVVPGDVTKDGVVDEDDVNWVVDVATGEAEIPLEDKSDPSTWFLKDLANLSDDTDDIDLDDVNYLYELVASISEI